VLLDHPQFSKFQEQLFGPYRKLDRGLDIGISSLQLNHFSDSKTGMLHLGALLDEAGIGRGEIFGRLVPRGRGRRSGGLGSLVNIYQFAASHLDF
jgi:hypothetical protein